jgi:hypothetical protein
MGLRRINGIFHCLSFVIGCYVCSVQNGCCFCRVHNGAGRGTSAEQNLKFNQVTEALSMTLQTDRLRRTQPTIFLTKYNRLNGKEGDATARSTFARSVGFD